MTEFQVVQMFYNLGLQHALKYRSIYEAINYGALDPYLNGDAGEHYAYTAGFEGADMPYKVRGWRYGDIPASGCSYNYREDAPEAGVSLVETACGLKTQDPMTLAHLVAAGRPVVRVEGWLNTARRGGDGEPLVFWARKIKD